MRSKDLLVLALVLTLGLSVAACAPASTQTGERGVDKGAAPQLSADSNKVAFWMSKWENDKPKAGGVMKRSQSTVAPSLDLISEGTQGTHVPVMPVYNSLLEYQYDIGDNVGFPSKIVPGLAERWSVSNDGLTYTFNLRKGVKFHDGKEFTSADAKFSIERIMKPPPKTPSLRSAWYTQVVDKLETPDPYTFVIKLNDLDAAFIAKIAAGYSPMVPKHILEPFNARITEVDLAKVVGTGPFKLVSGKREVSWHLKKNENYWKPGMPYLDAIDDFVIIEAASAAAAFEAGELDTTSDSAIDQSKLRSIIQRMEDKVNAFSSVSAGGLGGTMFFNTNRKPFDDVRVRKAIMMGIDWRAIEKVVYEGRSCIGGYQAPQGNWGISCEEVAKIKGYGASTPENKVEAKKLLAEAGYPNGFDVTILMGYGATNDQIHQMVQQMLPEIGVKVNLRPMERTAYYNAMNTGDFEMNSMGALAALDDPNDHLALWIICEGGRNYGKFCDQKVEQLYKQQSKELNVEKRKKIYRELELYLLEQAPMVQAWGTGEAIGIVNRSYMKGWIPMAGRHTQFNWETIWMDK